MTFTYSLTDIPTTILRSDGALIPTDQRNVDYAAYLEWVAAGNTPAPAPVPSAAVQALAQLEAQDGLMFRGLEVLIDVLIAKHAIVPADVNPTIRDLYLARKSLRVTAGVP